MSVPPMQARTSVKGPPGTPFWAERFTFGDVACSDDMLTVTLYQQKQGVAAMLVRDIEVGTAELPLATLNDSMRDEWVRLLDGHAEPVGTLRIQAAFSAEDVLPHDQYIPFTNVCASFTSNPAFFPA